MATSTLTLATVQELLNYNPKDGVFTWKVKRNNFVKKGSVAGCADTCGHIMIRINGVAYMAHMLAWFIQTGEWPEKEVDHIDRNPANNSWDNLRYATDAENAQNRSIASNNTSGVKGVSYDHSRRKYRGKVTFNGVEYRTKRCDTLAEAEALTVSLRERLHGEFACNG